MKPRIKHIAWFLFICLAIGSLYFIVKPAINIAVQPFGDVDDKYIDITANALKEQYQANIIVLPSIEHPKQAYYEPRNRYRADSLIAYLKRSAIAADHVIGITEKDISTTKGQHRDWGVFGLGYRPGKSCIVSTYRLKKADQHLIKERIQKVAVHEIGHNLGLPHCINDSLCVMNDACGTLKEVDRNNKSICSFCKLKSFYKH